jgi:hypothetical protein
VGTVGGTQQGQPDAAPQQGTPDAPPAATIDVSGKTMDYFTALAMPSATYTTDGMTPAMSGTSGADGSFTLANVPPASSFYVLVSGDAANYYPTRNDAVTVTDKSVMTNLYAVTMNDMKRQYSTVGLTRTTGTGMSIITLVRNNGTPLEGVKPTDITLTDAAGKPVVGFQGPYFFGPNGDIMTIATLAVSTAYNGSARTAILDLPPGSYTLNVSYPNAAGTIMTMTVPIMSAADSVTLLSTAHAVAPGAGTGGGGATPLSFATDVYPMLQRAALGGQGCANCHNATALAGGLAYDGPAATVYSKIMATPNVVVVATPATSMLLSMPLYETPPDLHPNATWLTNLDPAYVKIMKWISQGAKP